MLGGRRRRRWVAVTVGVFILLGAAVAWLLWPSPSPRARVYTERSACLLTDADGVAGVRAAPVWAGMQEASAATRAKVQFLAVVGPQTEQNALPYLTSLALRHCDVVLAVGPAQVAAVAVGAPRFPTVRFVVIGDGAQGANVSQVASSQRDEVRLAVKAAVVPLVGDR